MKFFITAFFCLSLLVVSAQKNKTIHGYLLDSVTKKSIVLGSVTDIKSGNTVLTDRNGKFHINATLNNTLSFSAIGYFFDTIQLTSKYLTQDTLYLLLQPLSRDLGNVTVFSVNSNQYQQDSIERRNEFLRDISNHTIPTVAQANSGAGIALNIDRFSKREKNKRKSLTFYERNEKEAYINYRFPAHLVAGYTGFKDEQLQQFMQTHRPTYQWLRLHTSEEDIKYYINEQLKLFKKQQ